MQPGELPPSVALQAAVTKLHIDDWLQNGVFRLKWWALAALLVACAAAWILLLDKSNAPAACLFAALGLILTMSANEFGDELLLWEYPADIIPIFPPLTSVNLLMAPLGYSLIYQRCPAAKMFWLWALLFTAVLCFAVEPLLALCGLYEPINWNYGLNFLLYAAIAAVCRFAVRGIDRIGVKARLAASRRT